MATHVEAQHTRDGWKLKATLGTAAIFAVVVLAFVFRVEAGIISLGLGSAIVGRLWMNVIEGRKDRQLDRREREANVGIVEEQYEQERIRTKQIKLAARIIETKFGAFVFSSLEDDSEPQYYAPTANERKMLVQGQLGTPQLPKPDLLKVFTQEEGAYAIIGDQRVGKTYQAMHIADVWIARGIIPVVVGMKRKPEEWNGCKHLFTDNTSELDTALRQIVQLGRDRHAGKSKTTPLPVFFDDWLWTVQNVPFAEKFMTEAGTVLRSAKIIVYLILQDDTKVAFGVKQYGAALKRGYYRLYLVPDLDRDGVVISGKASGYLVAPSKSESDKQAVDLIRGVPRCVDLQSEPPQAIELPEVKPEMPAKANSTLDPQQVAEFVRLVSKEGQSRRAACQMVFSKPYAGHLVDPLKKALESA